MSSILEGAYDLHIHCWPDVVERKVSDFEMAERAIAAGMKGFVIKAHYVPTAARAAVTRKQYPACNAVGAVVLNTTVGGINPMAVECAAKMGARIVWFPTMDASHDQQNMLDHLPQHVAMQAKLKEMGVPVKPVGILNEEGKLIPSVYDVLAVAKEHDLAVATGHMSHPETFAMVKAAHETGVRKIIITHADWESTYYSVEDQKILVGWGAMIEHSFTSPWLGHVAWEEVYDQIRQIGTEHCYISTDLGQKQNIFPDDGLREYAERLLENGFSEQELRRMLAENTAFLVEEC